MKEKNENQNLRDQVSQEAEELGLDQEALRKLLKESDEILDLALKAKDANEFIGDLARGKSKKLLVDFKYDHVLDFIIERTRRDKKQKKELADSTRKHLTSAIGRAPRGPEVPTYDPQAALAFKIHPIHGHTASDIEKPFATFLTSPEKQDRWIKACEANGYNLFYVHREGVWEMVKNDTGQSPIDLDQFDSFKRESLERMWKEHNPMRQGKTSDSEGQILH